MVNDANVSRHLDFIIAFKEALKENLDGNTGLDEVFEQLTSTQNKSGIKDRIDSCSIIFRYAMDLAMRQVVPTFLQLLREEADPEFIQELAETLHVDWSDELYCNRSSDNGNSSMVN